VLSLSQSLRVRSTRARFSLADRRSVIKSYGESEPILNFGGACGAMVLSLGLHMRSLAPAEVCDGGLARAGACFAECVFKILPRHEYSASKALAKFKKPAEKAPAQRAPMRLQPVGAVAGVMARAARWCAPP
jgi:hypothetical protein